MSVSGRVQRALEEKPFLLEALASGYANVSAVARLLQRELSGSETAVRAAVKRFAASKLKQRKMEERRILEVVKKSTLSLETKIGVMVVEKTPLSEAKAIKSAPLLKAWVKSPSGMTLIVSDENWNEVSRLFTPVEVLRSHRGLVAIIMVSSPRVDSVPGVVAFLTAQLAREGINIVEVWSSYTDTVFLVGKQDATKTYQVLSALV